MTIQITGASGFVGQNLQQYLKGCRYEVNTISLRNMSWHNFVNQKATALIHLAGKAHDTANTSAMKNTTTQWVFALALLSGLSILYLLLKTWIIRRFVDNR